MDNLSTRRSSKRSTAGRITRYCSAGWRCRYDPFFRIYHFSHLAARSYCSGVSPTVGNPFAEHHAASSRRNAARSASEPFRRAGALPVSSAPKYLFAQTSKICPSGSLLYRCSSEAMVLPVFTLCSRTAFVLMLANISASSLLTLSFSVAIVFSFSLQHRTISPIVFRLGEIGAQYFKYFGVVPHQHLVGVF